MRTVTYKVVKQLAADLADRPQGKLPTGEAAILRDVLAEELIEVWNREAWPELSDHMEAVTCTDKTFSTDTMGDVLGVFEGGDPRTQSAWQGVEWTQGNGVARVLTDTGQLYVEWQEPAPDLLAEVYDNLEMLDALLLPARFSQILARLGAAALLEAENPVRAMKLRSMAEADLVRQAGLLRTPWWRRPLKKS